MDANSVLDRARESSRVERLLRQRLGTQWHAGDRLPTIKQIARQLKVGQNSTLRAVQQLVQEGLLASRPRQGTFVVGGEAVSETGGTLPASALRGKAVQVLVPWTHPDPFAVNAIDAAMGLLRRLGCDAQVTTHRRGEGLSEMAGDGLLLINPPTDPPLRPRPGQPLVVCDTAIDCHIDMDAGYDVVGFDSDHAGYLAGSQLRRLGCEHVCFLGSGPRELGKRYDLTSQTRLRGLERGLGRRLPANQQFYSRYYMSVAAAKVVGEMLRLLPRFDGICAASDELAVGLIHGLAAHDLEAGKDYKLIGFDGQQLGRVPAGGPIATIEAPMAAMGRTAAQCLAERMTHPDQPVRRIMLTGRLFEGATAQK